MSDSREEDDDYFIYGISVGTSAGNTTEAVAPITTAVATGDDSGAAASNNEPEAEVEAKEEEEQEGEEQESEEEEEEEEEEDSDIEIILDPEERHRAMSRDFRQQGSRQSYDGHQPASSGTPPPGSSRAPHLTTEYTPTPRGEALVPKNIAQPLPPPPPPQKTTTATVATMTAATTTTASSVTSQTEARPATPDQDTSLLPPVTAPPSHPIINPSEPGVIDGRSILEVDMDALSEKPWRRPGTDISDYFNYGFDEISWEAYCYRRRDMTEMANQLKGAVTGFAGLPEDQITALPPEVRAMVMAGATALMSGGAMPHTGPQMMGVPVPPPSGMMNPHEMNMMGVMAGNDMQPMQAASMMPGTVPDGEMMNLSGMGQEGFQQSGPLGGGGAGQIMPMPQDFTIQDSSVMGLFPQNMESSGPGNGQSPPIPGSSSASSSTPTGPAAARPGTAPPMGPFRGRGTPIASMPLRGRGTFARGKGRGGTFGSESGPPPIPIRPASPLPPGVPTGPRNQNRYKDRDGNAPAVEGLDYGGGMQNNGDMDDRTARKRRGSPSVDDGRTKRR